MNDQKRQLINTIESVYGAKLSDWSPFIDNFRQHDWPAHYHWIEAGQCAKQLCFITQGLMRVYYIDQGGNEVNQQFHEAGEFIAPISAIVDSEPCQYYIQTLEPAKVWLANYDHLNKIGRSNAQWLTLEVKIMQQVYLATARREASLLLGNAEKRYKWFCRAFPELLDRIPQYHIASFLGITPVSLSRLRKCLNK